MNRTDSQKARILLHLQNGLTITPKQADRQYGCMRLAARIGELKDEGHNIRTDMIKAGGARVARYALVR